MERLLSRRGVLAGIGVSGVAAGLAAMSGEADAASSTVRGTWLIKPASAGGPSGFQALAAFAAGGVFVTTGSDQAGTGLGEWTSTDGNGFVFTYLNFHFDTAGKLANTVRVRAAGKFNGSRLSGHATLSTFGPTGKRLHADGRFTFNGTRVRAQAP